MKTRRLARGLGVALVVVAAAACQPPPRYDLVVRGGTLVDGTGQPGRAGDVGIIGDRIAFLGDLSGADAERVINAAGLVVAPGFIDPHGRSGVTLLLDGPAESHVRQGVTSQIIAANAAPVFGAIDAATAGRLESYGVTPDWTGFEGYATRLQERGVAINVGVLAPAELIRARALGAEARAASAADLSEMEALVDEAMAAGALGVVSESWRAPDAALTPAELRVMAVASTRAGGVLAVALGAGGPGADAVGEALDVGREAGARLVLFHLTSPATMSRPDGEAIAARVREAVANGVNVSGTMTPYALRMPAAGEGTGGEATGETAAAPVPSEGEQVAAGLRSGSVMVGTDAEAVRAEGALSSRGAPRAAYGAFPQVLGAHVREGGALALEEAVRRMTSLAASQFGLERRGILRETWSADLVVFDPETIADRSTPEVPQRYPAGIHHVIVNGVPVVSPDGLTGARPGRPLYGRARGQ